MPCFMRRRPTIDPIDESISLQDVLLCSVCGVIFAIYKVDGSILWKFKSPVGSSGGIVSLRVLEKEGRVVVGARGRTACLDIRRPDIIWTRKMPRRWICNEVILNMDGEPSETIGTAASPSESKRNPNDAQSTTHAGQAIVAASTWGRVFGYHRETGDLQWRFNCPGGRFGFPATLRAGNILFVGCNTMLYCIHLQTGQLLWKTGLLMRPFSLANYFTMATTSHATSDQDLVHVENLETKIMIAAKIVFTIIIQVAKNAG